MSQKRMGLGMLIGSLVLVTPFVVGFSQDGEKTIFSAMATLTDVKETLEAKRDLLRELQVQVRALPEGKRKEKAEVAEKHYAYATDVHRLARNFLDASSKRHPKYATFWSKYDKTLTSLWSEIEGARKALAAPTTSARMNSRKAPAAQVAQAPRSGGVPATVQPVRKSVPAAPVQAPRITRENLLAQYREAYRSFARGGKQDLDQSRVTFEQILQVEPSFHLARYWLARTYLLQDQVAEARGHAERLLRDQPNLQIAKDLIRDVADIQSLKRPSAPVQVARATPARGIPARVAPPAPVKSAGVRPVRSPAAPVQVAKAAATPAKAIPARVVRAPAVQAAPRAPVKPVAAPVRVAAKPAPVPARKPAPSKAPARPAPRKAAAKSAQGLELASLPPLSRPSAGKPQRPIAVMIENSRFSRPQSGLLAADYVFEMPVEGGITRFMAVYQDQVREVEELGPVRSARHYFVHQMPALDGIYAHCGGSTQGYAALKKDKVDHIDEIRSGWGFWRNKKRKAPHNLYTKLANVVKQARKKGFRMETTSPLEVLPTLDQPRSKALDHYVDIQIPYYSKYKVRYTYDPVTNEYARFINDEAHTDALADRQIAVENVVLVKTAMRKIDDYGRLDLELFGRGEATVFRGGERVDGFWIRQGKDSLMQIRDARGQPVAMNPGRTWIHMLQPNRKIQLAKRPLPPQALAKLAARSRKPAKATTTSRASVRKPEVDMKLARMPAAEGVPAVIARPGPTTIPNPGKSSVGLSATVVARKQAAALPPRLAPAPRKAPAAKTLPRAAQSAAKVGSKVAKVPPKVASPVAGELPPKLAQAPVEKAPVLARAPSIQNGLTAAQVPEELRPLPPRPEPSQPRANTWKNNSGSVYDLADFSLDSF